MKDVSDNSLIATPMHILTNYTIVKMCFWLSRSKK